jgi:hypothetical protein
MNPRTFTDEPRRRKFVYSGGSRRRSGGTAPPRHADRAGTRRPASPGPADSALNPAHNFDRDVIALLQKCSGLEQLQERLSP